MLFSETLRVGNLLAQNIFRKVDRDIEIDGMVIKKGSVCIPQISVFLLDPENFERPNEFDPSRFLDENGQLKRCNELVPFSLGKRACMQTISDLKIFDIFRYRRRPSSHGTVSIHHKYDEPIQVYGRKDYANTQEECRWRFFQHSSL
jgi:hypothetical protein